jgi:hypothetical protein
VGARLVSDFVGNVRACRQELLTRWPRFVELAEWKEAQPEYKDKFGSYTNTTGKAISYLLQSAEDVAIEEMRLFYKEQLDIPILALMFDGILFEQHTDVQEKMQQAQTHVRKTFGWTYFKLDEKPFNCGWHVPSEESNNAIVAYKLTQLDGKFCCVMLESTPKVINTMALDDTSKKVTYKDIFHNVDNFVRGLGRVHSGFLMYKKTEKEEVEYDDKGNFSGTKKVQIFEGETTIYSKETKGGNVCATWYYSHKSTTADSCTFNLDLAPNLQKERDERGNRIYNLWKGLQELPIRSEKYSWVLEETKETVVVEKTTMAEEDGDDGKYQTEEEETREVTRWDTENPIMHFILHSLCNGCKERFDYLMLWCAITVTYPELKMPVGMVIKGPQGVGKGMLANKLMGSFFGSHFVHCSNPDHIMGEKNALIQLAVFTSMGECFLRGDHKAKAVLNSMLTDDIATLRKMFCDAVNIRTFNHIMISSNEDLCAYLDHDDCRFAVLNAMDTHANEPTYWKRVAGFMENDGGREGFLYHLMYGLRAEVNEATNGGKTPLNWIPQIKDMDRFEMKLLSMPPVQRWLYERVLTQKSGSLIQYTESEVSHNSIKYPLLLRKKNLYAVFMRDSQHKGKQFTTEATFTTDALKFLNTGRHIQGEAVHQEELHFAWRWRVHGCRRWVSRRIHRQYAPWVHGHM